MEIFKTAQIDTETQPTSTVPFQTSLKQTEAGYLLGTIFRGGLIDICRSIRVYSWATGRCVQGNEVAVFPGELCLWGEVNIWSVHMWVEHQKIEQGLVHIKAPGK